MVVLRGHEDTFAHCQPVWRSSGPKCSPFIGSDCNTRSRAEKELTIEMLLFCFILCWSFIFPGEGMRKHRNFGFISVELLNRIHL
ncbi:hypothetical protein F7725_001126 [Dissostichus mawsoni]|uniref:Uncharacterized protein n=1 Tax=Dissostichus mawsoni TaxID=36200 RepID=A0A7J5ZI91_DISMA|nr:hypothetical protein F7725_001126 [Dissostichus mawsoni]